MRVFWMVPVLLAMLALSGRAEAEAPESLRLLEVRAREIPAVRAWLQVPSAAWAKATGVVEMTKKPTPEELELLAKAREAAKGDLPPGVVAPALPEDPVTRASATLSPSAKAADPSQALLVVFLVDTSPSMRPHLATVRRLAGAVVEKLETLGKDNRVALVRFAETDAMVVSPTTTYSSITNAIDTIKVSSGEMTWLYRAIVRTMRGVASAGEEPSIPGRRILIAISDGLDNEGGGRVAEFRAALSEPGQNVTILTVGVGGTRAAYADLSAIADLAGHPERFVADPSPADLTARVEAALRPLDRQVAADFELPPLYWKPGSYEALLTLEHGGSSQTVPLTVLVGAVTKEQQEAQALVEGAARQAGAFLDSLKEGKVAEGKAKDEEERRRRDAEQAAKEEAEKAAAAAEKAAAEEALEADRRKSRTILWSTVGGAVVILLIALFLVARRTRRRQEEQADQINQVGAGLAEQMQRQSQQLQEEARKRADEAANAARVALGVLLAEDGPLKGRRFGILKPSCIAGRDADQCELVFPSEGGDLSISRVHAQFTMAGGSWNVTCLAEGGMGVNAVRLARGEHYPVRINDRVVIGRTGFRFINP